MVLTGHRLQDLTGYLMSSRAGQTSPLFCVLRKETVLVTGLRKQLVVQTVNMLWISSMCTHKVVEELAQAGSEQAS